MHPDRRNAKLHRAGRVVNVRAESERRGRLSLRSGVQVVLIRGGVLRHFNSKAAPFGPPIRFARLSVTQRGTLRLLGNEVFRPVASPWRDMETAPTAPKDRY